MIDADIIAERRELIVQHHRPGRADFEQLHAAVPFARFPAEHAVDNRTGRYQHIAMVALASGRIAHFDQCQVGGKTRDAKYLAGETLQNRDRRRQVQFIGQRHVELTAKLRILADFGGFERVPEEDSNRSQNVAKLRES